MSRTYVPRTLREQISEDDRSCCAYCQSAVRIVGMSFEIDHIIPESLGGLTVRENLCLCCSGCNERKSCRTAAPDPVTHRRVALFHPRRQVWSQHFRWADKGRLIAGLTPVGRATIQTLQLNRLVLVTARESWILVGWHPPGENRTRKRRPR